MIDKMHCAKCMVYAEVRSMRLIKMGKAKRLVCQACAERKTASWFGGQKK